MKTTTRDDYLDRIRRVLRFVQQHLDEPLTPAVLAGVAHVSVYHFHRIFSGLVGESVSEHVRRLRLERAAGDLRRSDDQVIDIALRSGYEAHEPFTRAFRSHFGMPPAEYRRRREPVVFPPVVCGVHYGADLSVSRFVPLEEGSHMIDVLIEPQPARRLFALPHHGDHQAIGTTFDRLGAMAGSLGLLTPETLFIGIYYDDPQVTPREELRSHACVTLPQPLDTLPEGAEVLNLDGGDFAIGVHRGPYADLPRSYDWLFSQWLPSSGREAADAPCHEIYVTDPQTTAEADLVTHVCVPLQPQRP